MLPALLIAFNRPEHTARVLDSLRDSGIQELYVSVDGPRNDEDRLAQVQVRDLIDSCTWATRVDVRLSEVNQGPGWGPRNAITWFFEQVPVGIIAEDDTVFSSQAGNFMTATAAEFNESVQMTSGTSLGARAYSGQAGFFASRYATTWGWATSRDAWSAYDHTMKEWPRLRTTQWLRDVGGSRAFADYWTNIFDMTYEDRDHYWDYQWQYAMWLNEWRCWHPRVNLVTNVGSGQEATHLTSHIELLTNLPTEQIEWPLKLPADDGAESAVDFWIDQHVYRTRRSLKGRIYRKIFNQT